VQTAKIDRTFGSAGNTVVIERFARGTEVTIMALSDGETVIPLLPSQDHKQVFDGDLGPNTGGMGAYAPADSVIDAEQTAQVVDRILLPTIRGLAAEDRRFVGVLYGGLMLTDEGPTVLEFNCRFGDPEAQAIIPLLDEDLGELFAAIADGSAPQRPLRWRDAYCACVILAAEGYPGKHRHGDPILGLDKAAQHADVVAFHSGTGSEHGTFVTTGGRVLGLTGIGPTLDEALESAYAAIDEIQFRGMHYRHDIGHRPTVAR